MSSYDVTAVTYVLVAAVVWYVSEAGSLHSRQVAGAATYPDNQTFMCTGIASPTYRNAIALVCSGTLSQRHIYVRLRSTQRCVFSVVVQVQL